MIDSLGFTGSSDGGMPMKAQFVEMGNIMVDLLPKHVHHGDCINSDEKFHWICRVHFATIIHVHPPTIDKKRAFCEGDVIYAPAPYLKRNKNIVAMSDVLLATPHGPEEIRSGTWATIRYARAKGIPIYVILPNGQVVFEPGNGVSGDLPAKSALTSPG